MAVLASPTPPHLDARRWFCLSSRLIAMRIVRFVIVFALLVGSASAAPLRSHSLPATGTVVVEFQKGSRAWLAASELDGSGSRALTAPRCDFV